MCANLVRIDSTGASEKQTLGLATKLDKLIPAIDWQRPGDTQLCVVLVASRWFSG
jgi:hypothetical protein